MKSFESTSSHQKRDTSKEVSRFLYFSILPELRWWIRTARAPRLRPAGQKCPSGAFLGRGLRIHQLPPKGCDKNVVTAFFLCCIAENLHLRRPIFKVRFTVLSNRFLAVGLFCLRILTACPLPCGLIFDFFQENFRFFLLFSECF